MDMLDALRCQVGRHEYQNPLIFGGGTCKILSDVIRALGTDAGGLEIGTILPKPSMGNAGPKVFYAHWVKDVLMFTLNSLGLPGPGRDAVGVWAREAITRAHDLGKKIGMNVAASTPAEIVEMVLWAVSLGFDWVTINGGCPNKFDEQGRPLAIFGFDEEAMLELVSLLNASFPDDTNDIWWKPPPYTDTVGALVRAARIIAGSSVITGYIASNTIAHCFAFDDDGTPAISPGGGLAGMAGPVVLPMVQGHLKLLDNILPKHMLRIGSGGATFGEDIADLQRCGADLVMATSVFWANPQGAYIGYGEANRMLAEYAELKGLKAA